MKGGEAYLFVEGQFLWFCKLSIRHHFQNVHKKKMSQPNLMTSFIAWHYLTQCDQKALWCNVSLLYVHHTHTEIQNGMSTSMLPLESCPAKAEWTDNPEEQRVLPMTTKLRSCFPPCRFSSSALTSICCLNLLDFFTGVCVELCSSDVWMVWDERADLETVSRTSEEAKLVSSLGCPLWGVWKLWPFSSAVTLQKAKIRKKVFKPTQLMSYNISSQKFSIHIPYTYKPKRISAKWLESVKVEMINELDPNYTNRLRRSQEKNSLPKTKVRRKYPVE